MGQWTTKNAQQSLKKKKKKKTPTEDPLRVPKIHLQRDIQHLVYEKRSQK